MICIVIPVAQVKAKLDGEAKQKHLLHSRQQDAVVSILRTANYLGRFYSPVFDQQGRVVAALNTSSHSRRISKAKLVRERLKMLQQVSQQISADLATSPWLSLSAQV